MVVYTEEVLDKCWREDSVKRGKSNREILHRESYRRLFEIALDEYLATGGEELPRIDIHIPDWVSKSIELELS